MSAHHYECPNCTTEFISESALYCPFCGSSLQQQKPARYAVRDYVTAGWNVIAFRSTRSGFITRDVVTETERATEE